MLKTKQGTRSKDRRPPVRARSRRTTLTLPLDILKEVERFARERRQTVSSATAYLLEEALRTQPSEHTSGKSFLELLQKSFAGLTEQEQMLVDGIILAEKPSPND
ncbi:MAG TPA: hypothetical protein VMT32_13080 [Bryobacteraceae bacterium]|nr:hypothetical protein [Bryobacteraceae bacterium]